ncbi:MAG TPA: hypothetical protein ENK65_02580, partial [Helicobacteraceae bacterium]|nr:hypothetical protein [Helicobacteraceae bacterium]
GSITLGSTQHVHIEVPHFVLPYDLYHKINSDAKKGLIIALKADASHEAGKVVLEGQLISDFITFTKIGLNTDLKQHDYQATTTLQTPLFPDDVKIAVQGNYQDKVVSSASINAPYERLTFKKIDYTTNNYEAPYFLRLKETPKDYKYFHHKAEVHGVITSQPVPRIYMNSQSFGGDMNASIDDTYAKVALHQVSLVKLLNFSDVDAPVNSGIMNADIRLQSHALFSENSDDINGAIHVNATNIEIQGINVDENINIIRNTQDISIFEGHIPGLSLLAKTLKTPMRLTGVSKEKSFIKEANIQARIVDSNLSCQDCAMKTKENRIAINGNIIINQNMAFENFYVGFLLDNGCAYYKQQIEGTITHPKVQTAVTSFNVITGTVSSAVDVVGDGISNVVSHIPGVDTLSRSAKKVSPEALNKALSKQECHPFHLGKVQ